MPNRIIKETIRTSKTINQMTDFQFRLWTYLLTYVDDYGRGSADPEILRGFIFPRRKGVTEASIGQAIECLANMGSINLYEVDGESYLYFPNWSDHQRIQARHPKFPDPAECDTHGASRCITVTHGDARCESNPIQANTKIESKAKAKSTRTRVDTPDLSVFSASLQEKVQQWLEYKTERKEKYTPTGLSSLVKQIQNKAEEYGDMAICELIDTCMAAGWKGIIFDRLTEAKKTKKPSNNSFDLDEIEELCVVKL